jgi:DNA-directed RNA polymerase subunit beta'
VWFFKGLPSRIGHLLDISLRDLERVLYFEAYVVVEPGDTELKQNQLLSEELYRKAREEHGREVPRADGREAIKELLKRGQRREAARRAAREDARETSAQKKLKYAKRLKVVDSFRKSTNKPEWMILDVIPVIPPELRPAGAARRRPVRDLGPERPLSARHQPQQPVEEADRAEGARRHHPQRKAHAAGSGRCAVRQRPSRARAAWREQPSAEVAERHAQGQAGTLPPEPARQARRLLGPLVIVVGPELKLHQCGLPKKMALELFKPFIYNKLEERGLVATIKQAKEMVEQQRPEVWDVLERSSASIRCC